MFAIISGTTVARKSRLRHPLVPARASSRNVISRYYSVTERFNNDQLSHAASSPRMSPFLRRLSVSVTGRNLDRRSRRFDVVTSSEFLRRTHTTWTWRAARRVLGGIRGSDAMKGGLSFRKSLVGSDSRKQGCLTRAEAKRHRRSKRDAEGGVGCGGGRKAGMPLPPSICGSVVSSHSWHGPGPNSGLTRFCCLFWLSWYAW